ncbi:MAG: radical SAM protein [archaeon]
MRLKLIYSPEFYSAEDENSTREPPKFPLISLPVIKSYLEKHGFTAHQDDLDAKVYHDNLHGLDNRRVDMALFQDKARIADYITRGSDDELEQNAEKMLKKTKTKGYDMVAFSFGHCWKFASIGAAMVMSKILKDRDDVLISAGGGHHDRTIAGVPFEDVPFVDFFCFLTNHFEFIRLLDCIESRQLSKRELFPSIVFNEEKIARHLDLAGYPVLQSRKIPTEYYTDEVIFPVPDFDGLPLELYRYIPTDVAENGLSTKKIQILPYYFVFGCPNRCIFCKDSQSDIFLTKDPGAVAEELKMLSKKHGANHFIFTNTSVNPTKNYAAEFSDQMIKNDVNVQWFDCAAFNSMDKSILSKLYVAGARRLLFGLECASPRMQKYLNKNVNLAQASALLKHSHKLNIWNELEMVCGLPHETQEDRDLSMQFLAENRRQIDYFYLTRFYLTQSLLTSNPLKYGITKIRETQDDQAEGLAFDEVDGAKWEDKKQQAWLAFRQYEQMRKQVFNPQFDNTHNHFYRIFYLYSIFDRKRDIRNYIGGCSSNHDECNS